MKPMIAASHAANSMRHTLHEATFFCDPKPILVACAKRAFSDLPLATVRSLALYLMMPGLGFSTLCEVLQLLCRECKQ